MLKLKKNIINFLKVNVKPICLERTIRGIEAEAPLHGGYTFQYRIDKTHSMYGIYIDFDLPKDCFEEIEELKPYKWHERELFDGNPKGYWVLERTVDLDSPLNDMPKRIPYIRSKTTHFMYIEPLKVDDED